MSKKKRILFVCTENSARSQMAEALMKSIAGDRFDVFSAGTRPSDVDARAIKAIERFGLSSEGLRSKSLDEFDGQEFDYVVSLCEKAAYECQPMNLGKQFMAWNFEDPKTHGGPNIFHLTIKDINERIKMFLLVTEKETRT